MRLRPALAVLLSATAATAVAVPAHADQGGVPNDKSQYTFALIGDGRRAAGARTARL